MGKGYIGEVDYSVEVIESMPGINEILAAALNGCVFKSSASKRLNRLRELPEEERKKKIEATFENSLGNGHNAAGDFPTVVVGFEQIPRLETLRHARQPRGFSLLQQSTRRVEHDSVYKPDVISKNKTASYIFDCAVGDVLDAYFRILDSAEDKNERSLLRQDAMFVLPLYLQTNNSICGSARGFWQYVTEGRDADMPEVVRDISHDTLRVLKEDNPEIFRDWKINYQYEEFYPSSSDFLAGRNDALVRLVREHKIGRGSKLISQMNPFRDWSVEDIRNGVIDHDPAVYANLVECKAQFLAKTDISVYHELFRQRTLNQCIDSFIGTMDDKDKTYFMPDSLKKRGFEETVSEMYSTLGRLYHDLQREGISKQDAVGVAPHGLEVYSLITIDGWNLIHLSGTRLCSTAKPSMQKWMKSMVSELKAADNPLSDYLVPKGKQYGFCPDNHPKGCDVCKVRK